MTPQPIKIIAAIGLVIGSSGINAAPVTVTAEFSTLTMGGFYSGEHTFANQLLVNGNSINVCGGDPACANAMSNPASVAVNLTGSSIDFGYDNGFRQNTFSFANHESNVTGTGVENPFTLGTFTFTNGGFYPQAFFDFTLTTHSTDAAFDNHTFAGRIRLDTNSTGAHPGSSSVQKRAEADYFVVMDMGGNPITSLGSARVYDYNICPTGVSAPDCNTGSVDLIGHINSLHLDGLANATGGAFLDSSTTSQLASVPVPTAVWLFGSGLLGLLGMRKSTQKS